MALESSPGGELLLEHVPLLGSHGAWNQVAYFDVHGWSGLATALTLWDADFDGFFNMQECLDNNFAVFTGASWDTEFGAPGTTTGRVCCFFEAPSAEYYVINVQLDSLTFESFSPVVAFFIDDIPIGERQWKGSINQPLAIHVQDGFHRFDIRQVSDSFHFRSVTIWQSLALPPASDMS